MNTPENTDRDPVESTALSADALRNYDPGAPENAEKEKMRAMQMRALSREELEELQRKNAHLMVNAAPSVDLPQLVRLSRYQKMPDDGCGEWIGAPNNGGDVGDMLDIVAELNGLLIALHDAINRPKGVVPESAERFYQANTQTDTST